MKYKAIIWDFGGVITSSPFEAFNQFEEANGLPKDIIRTINSENPDTNAWAKFESNSITIDVFNDLFLKEAKAKGFDIKGIDIIKLLKGSIRKNMVSFLRELKSDFKLGCITNNVKSSSEENNDNEALFTQLNQYNIYINFLNDYYKQQNPKPIRFDSNLSKKLFG